MPYRKDKWRQGLLDKYEVLYPVAPAQEQRVGGATISYPEMGLMTPKRAEGAEREPTFRYFEPPPYAGPEDIQGVPQFQVPEAAEPEFYSLTEGDYERLEKDLFEGAMTRAGSWAAAHGVFSSGTMERGAAQAASEAMRTRYGLQVGEQARRTEWEQQERLSRWQEKEVTFRAQQSAYQQAQQEAQLRNTWMWNTYTMQHTDYWNEISTLLSNVLAPYGAVPFQGVTYGVP